MRTSQNETAVNKLLGKIDLMEERQIKEMLNQLGNSEEAVRRELDKRIVKMLRNDEKYPINEMFTYGISGGCIHLHLPGNLEPMINRIGPRKTMDTVNLWLLDALGRIAKMREQGYYRFEECQSIYMISPILRRLELIFLEELGFDTQIYTKEQLKDSKFLEEHPEAGLANTVFGADRKIGTASIGINKITTPEWEAKKQEVIRRLNQKGILIEEEARIGGDALK